MEKKLKEKAGITLIILVVTIVVLLILAGITINTLVGENGIITRAIKAEEETKKSQYEELINIIIMEKKIERSQNPKEEDPFIKVVADAISKKEWEKEVILCDENENTQIEPEKCNKIIVETTDGYEIIVNINKEEITGEVVSITKGKAPKYIVSFHANGAKGEEPEPIERRKGFFVILPKGEKLSNTDKKIIGWSEKEKPKEGEDKIYACGSSYQSNKEKVTLYAIWAENTVTISFDKNQGEDGTQVEGEMNQITVGVGKPTTLPKNTFSKSGYKLKEWNTTKEGNGTGYTDEGEIIITQDTTLYAIWEEDIRVSLTIKDNKFTEGTTISMEASAIAKGIQKIELIGGKVWDVNSIGNILYEENVEGNTSYSKSNLGLDDLKDSLKYVKFYDTEITFRVTTTTGKKAITSVEIKNYTVGTHGSLVDFMGVVNYSKNSLAGETIIQLCDILVAPGTSEGLFQPIGRMESLEAQDIKFSGTYDGKGYSIEIRSNCINDKYFGVVNGVFGFISEATIKNLNTKGSGFGVNTAQATGGIAGVAKILLYKIVRILKH